MREIKFRTFQEEKMYHHKLCNYLGSSGIVNPYVGCENAIWMQYTGLKDKNGLDIYESDVILYQECKGVVYYCNDTCMFMAKFKTTDSSWSFDSMDDEINVIGNIHENLELFK